MILSDKYYDDLKRAMYDLIDMAYMAGVEQKHGETIRDNPAFKKYRHDLADWGMDRHGISSITEERIKKMMSKPFGDGIIFKGGGLGL